MAFYGGQQVGLNLGGQATNRFALQAGEAFTVPPGFWAITHGVYTTIQDLDPVTGIWRPVGSDGSTYRLVQSDGTNFRLANQTGCVVGVLLTVAGSGYTSAPTVTFGAGGAKATAIVGGAVNTSVTVVNGGTNYIYPPLVVFQAPPVPGIQATGYSTISGGAVTTVTVTDQGAGYTTAPPIALVNDPRDNTGSGATAQAVLTGAQTVTGILVTDHGTPVTTLPSVTISGGGGSSAVGTAIMNWTATGFSVTGGGAGYTLTNNAISVMSVGTGIPTTATAYTNPSTQTGLLRGRSINIQIATLNSGALTATGQTILDGGSIGGVAGNITPQILSSIPPTTLGTLALTVGGTNDFFSMQKQ